MSDENEELNIVEISDENDNVTKCEIYDIVEFEGKTYALLLPIEEESDDEPELIVLEYVEEGDEGFFQNIDDEKEFERVCEYIQSIPYEEYDVEE